MASAHRSGLLLLCLLAGSAAAQGLPDGTNDCLATLTRIEATIEPGDDPAWLGDHCQTFYEALEGSAWAAGLADGEAYFLEREGLQALIDLADDYGQRLRPAPAAATLDSIVVELQPFGEPETPSLWERFVDWFNGLFQSDDGDRSLLGEWLESLSIPDAWQKPIMLAIVTIAVLTVLAILINELRLGGAFVGKTGRALRQVIGARLAPADPVPTFASIAGTADLTRRVELLFALVVDRLRRRHPRGGLAPGLTHREFVHAAAALAGPARDSLRSVASAAERVTYGNWQPSPEDWPTILASGETVMNLVEREEQVQA